MSQFNVNRRNLIKTSLVLGASASLAYVLRNSLVRPSLEDPDHFIVVVALSGGADVTQSLDPQFLNKAFDEQDYFAEYSDNQIIKKNNILLGPAAQALLPYHQDICIVNGVSAVNDFGHLSNLSQILSGSLSGEFSHYAVQIAGRNQAKPLGTLTNEAIVIRQSDAVTSDISRIFNKFTTDDASLAVRKLANIISPDLKQRAENLEANDNKAYKLYRFINRKESIAEASFAAVASCFAAGLSQTAAIDMSKMLNNSYFDSHTNHAGLHMRSHKEAWDQVATLFDIFKSVPYSNATLFDQTTFLVVSEFSRRPFLNTSLGKDHNPYANSVLFAGRGVKGNQVIGQTKLYSRKETSDGLAMHTGLPLDFNTGKIVLSAEQNAEIILPENIARTLFEIFKIKDIPKAFEKYKVIPNLVKV